MISPSLCVNEPFKARLHQASASMQSQHCDDTCDIVLIEINGVTPKWAAAPFRSVSICFHWFEWELCCEHHHSVDSALTLSPGVSGPLNHNPRNLLCTVSLPGSRVISRKLHHSRLHRYYKLRIVIKCRNLYLLDKDYNRVIALMITVVSLLSTNNPDTLSLYSRASLYSHLFYLKHVFAINRAWPSLKVHPH